MPRNTNVTTNTNHLRRYTWGTVSRWQAPSCTTTVRITRRGQQPSRSLTQDTIRENTKREKEKKSTLRSNSNDDFRELVIDSEGKIRSTSEMRCKKRVLVRGLVLGDYSLLMELRRWLRLRMRTGWEEEGSRTITHRTRSSHCHHQHCWCSLHWRHW